VPYKLTITSPIGVIITNIVLDMKVNGSGFIENSGR
jgi:hypothetical protein